MTVEIKARAVKEDTLPGNELMRYLTPGKSYLTSVRDDGTTWQLPLGSKTWRYAAQRKSESFTYEEWYARKVKHFQDLPFWARNVKRLPSKDTLKRWVSDSVCKSVTGHTVEPDGHSPDGAPSWLLALGMI